MEEETGTPRCECDPGFHAEGLQCIEDQADPCEGVTCSGHGDLPAVTNPGRYMVIEGTWSLGFCRRGPHLNVSSHGAVVSTKECSVW